MAGDRKLTLLWESELIRDGENRARVVARKPLKEMSTGQAAECLGVSKWTVNALWRAGLINGYKPGARKARTDGKGSNAKLVLDAGSVLNYKAERDGMSTEERN